MQRHSRDRLSAEEFDCEKRWEKKKVKKRKDDQDGGKLYCGGGGSGGGGGGGGGGGRGIEQIDLEESSAKWIRIYLNF